MSSRRNRICLWSLLTVLGFVVPNAYVVSYFRENGMSPEAALGFFREWGNSTPTKALTADLGITSGAFWAWSLWDSRENGVKHWWTVPASTCGVGICMSVPLYFLLRELAEEA